MARVMSAENVRVMTATADYYKVKADHEASKNKVDEAYANMQKAREQAKAKKARGG